MKVLVVGGFEPSGHDSTAEAILTAGTNQPVEFDYLLWRDRIELAEHPMFVSHRIAAKLGCHEIAGLLDEDWIGDVLSADLMHHIDIGYDAYVCIHPWSSLVVAQALRSKQNHTSLLIDYHSEFGSFPVIQDDRIDLYLGGGPIKATEPKIRSKCHSVGVSVPQRFVSPDLGKPALRKRRLIVSAGSDGWAIRAMAASTKTLMQHLQPDETVLLAPSAIAAEIWKTCDVPGARTEVGITDISPLLKSSKWYLSKGGGTAVAEGLVAGCSNYVSYSGIFWEDEACQRLHAHKIVNLVEQDEKIDSKLPSKRHSNNERQRCIHAPDQLWKFVLAGRQSKKSTKEIEVLSELISNIDQHKHDVLPRTTKKLRERLLAWREGWQDE